MTLRGAGVVGCSELLGLRCTLDYKGSVVTVLFPFSKRADLNALYAGGPLTRQKTVVDVVGFALRPLPEEGRFTLLPVGFASVLVIGTHQSVRVKPRDHRRVIVS